MHVSHTRCLAAEIVKEFSVPCDSQSHSWSTLGGSGCSTAERDLHSWLKGAFDLHLELGKVPVPIKDAADDWQLPIIDPVNLVQHMWEAGPRVFRSCMIGAPNDELLREYWSRSADFGWLKSHPHRPDPSDHHRTIPIRLHGDMARAFNTQKILIISWMSGVMSGCSWNSRML